MDAKRGQIPGKPDEMQKKEFSKRQIRGPSVPRAQEWSSPFRAKMELKITDSTAPALGRAPAILISEVRDREGEGVDCLARVTLGQRRRQVLTLSSTTGNSLPAPNPTTFALPSGCSLKKADVLLSVYQHSGRRDPVLGLHTRNNRTPLNLEAISDIDPTPS